MPAISRKIAIGALFAVGLRPGTSATWLESGSLRGPRDCNVVVGVSGRRRPEIASIVDVYVVYNFLVKNGEELLAFMTLILSGKPVSSERRCVILAVLTRFLSSTCPCGRLKLVCY